MMTQAAGGGHRGDGRAADNLGFTFEDPLSSLPQTARNLLLAAREIIADAGFGALTLSAVSERAGENKAMISYYFENKAGLVAAVLDSVIHDEYLLTLDRMKDVGEGERIPTLIEEMWNISEVTDDYEVFFELLPHVLRDAMLRRRFAALLHWFLQQKLVWLGADPESPGRDDPDLLGLAQLLAAVMDGLAIQVAVDPEMDLSGPYRLLGRMLELLYASRGGRLDSAVPLG